MKLAAEEWQAIGGCALMRIKAATLESF